MSATLNQAKDTMYTMLMTDIIAQSPSIIGYVPNITFHGSRYSPPPANGIIPPADKYHGVSFVHVMKEEQKTLCHDVDTLGSRRYNNRGVFEFQIMCPLSDAQNSDKGDRLAYVAQKAFRGKEGTCGIVFYDAMYKSGATGDVFSKYIMTVKYNYDEVSL